MSADHLEEKLMGTTARLIANEPLSGDAADGQELIDKVLGFLRDYEARLSRFNPDSELNALNADKREQVPASPMLCQAVEAALWAAEFSDGLIDPTLLGQLKAGGYEKSFDNSERLDLATVIDRLEERPAKARDEQLWREIKVGDGFISRPVGLEIEIGGSGKGWACDLVAPLFEGQYNDWLVNLGGDMRLGGEIARLVEVISPFDRQVLDSFPVLSGGVATSGIDSRLWIKDDKPYHHLLDPSTGLPAFAGIISATAYGASALEAEAKAKIALLTGNEEILAEGGVLVFADGTLRRVGRLATSQKSVAASG